MEIRPASYVSETAQRLAKELTTEVDARYDGRPGLGPVPTARDFEAPGGGFLIAYEGEEPVGTGGLAPFGARTAELRRMYVVPAARGRGISRRLLGELEELACSLGYTKVRVETGDRQPEAIGLYQSAGYVRIAKYGAYVNDERSVCFEKTLEPR